MHLTRKCCSASRTLCYLKGTVHGVVAAHLLQAGAKTANMLDCSLATILWSTQEVEDAERGCITTIQLTAGSI